MVGALTNAAEKNPVPSCRNPRLPAVSRKQPHRAVPRRCSGYATKFDGTRSKDDADNKEDTGSNEDEQAHGCGQAQALDKACIGRGRIDEDRKAKRIVHQQGHHQ